MYQDLSKCHDWPVKNVIVDLPISLKGNLKCISGNLLSLLVALVDQGCWPCFADITSWAYITYEKLAMLDILSSNLELVDYKKNSPFFFLNHKLLCARYEAPKPWIFYAHRVRKKISRHLEVG